MIDTLLGITELGVFFGLGHTFKRWHKKQSALQKFIEYIQKKSPVGPSDLQSFMENIGSDHSLEGTRGFAQDKTFSKGLVLVKGIVQADQSIRSMLNHTTELVQTSVTLEQMFSNSRSFEKIEGTEIVQRVSEFRLLDQESPHTSLTLSNNFNVRAEDAFNQIHSKEYTRSLTPVEQVLNWMMFCFRLFLSMSNINKKMSGFKVGARRIEKGIMVGQFMIAFGEVVFDRFSKTLRMNNPIHFMKNKEQLLKYLREKNTKMARNMTLIMSILLIVGFLILKRMLGLAKTAMKKYTKMKQNKKLDIFQRLNKIKMDDFRCLQCGEGARTAIYKPCLHLVLCTMCDSKQFDRRCPKCNEEIEETVKIFSV